MANENIKAVIEALLFTSENPVSAEQVRNICDSLSLEEVRGLLGELKSDYEKSGRGMRIAEIAGGFQMITASDFAPFLKKFYKQRRVERLSQPALETLAIIAYKQPVSKIEASSIRNVSIDGLIKGLLDKGLVRIVGRKKAPGRPYLFGTTRQFLEYFGLKSLDELPKIEGFSALKMREEANVAKRLEKKD